MIPRQQWRSLFFRSLSDSSRSRRSRITVAGEIEPLEPRLVLAVTTSVSPNISPGFVNLAITVNAGDSVAVGTMGDAVTVNGTVVLDSLGDPLLAADVGSLSIVCDGNFANSIDIGDVTDAAFTGLTRPSIFGDRGNDTIVGSELSGDDTVFRDVIDGGDGNDSIYAGGGSDAVYGGAGDDSIASEGGCDSIFGDAGDDLLVAGGDATVDVNPITGNPLNWDFADGGSGCDDVHSFESHGGPGNDTVTGSTLIDGSPSGDSGLNIVNTVSDGGMSEECAGIEVLWDDGSGTASSDRVTYEDQSKPAQRLKIRLTDAPGIDKFVDVEITVELITLTTSAEATVNPATIHFTNDNWSGVDVDVKGVDDAPPEVDGTQLYMVHVKVTDTDSGLYEHFNNEANSEIAAFYMENIDNDGDLFEFVTPAEPLTTEGGFSFQIDVRLKQAPHGIVMIPVKITGTDPDEAQSSVAALYFEPEKVSGTFDWEEGR